MDDNFRIFIPLIPFLISMLIIVISGNYKDNGQPIYGHLSILLMKFTSALFFIIWLLIAIFGFFPEFVKLGWACFIPAQFLGFFWNKFEGKKLIQYGQ